MRSLLFREMLPAQRAGEDRWSPPYSFTDPSMMPVTK